MGVAKLLLTDIISAMRNGKGGSGETGWAAMIKKRDAQEENAFSLLCISLL
jgi:hypothetical protein